MGIPSDLCLFRSWKAVASALDDTSSDRIACAAISAFLRDAYVHQLLKAPLKAFEPPTAQSKTDLETKTSAINVVPDPSDPFKIEEIKADAKWLSEQAKVNEVAALRISVLEYQSRAQHHLAGPLCTQDITVIQEAAGVSDAQASSILSFMNVSAVADADTTWAFFETETARRQRILAIYFSERRSFMSASDALMTFLLHSRATVMGPEVDSLRQSIARDAFGFDESTNMNTAAFETLVPTYLGLLDGCISRMQAGLGIADMSIATEQLELDCARTSLTEIIHAMSLAFQVIDLGGHTFSSPEVVSQWFGLMGNYDFFDPVVGVSTFPPRDLGRVC